MKYKKVLITGGAGFVGANLAIQFKRYFEGTQIMCLDNLKRRGSQLNLPRLRENGVQFLHGDIRCREDFDEVGEIDLLIDCAAEPSVHSGAQGNPDYVINTNLQGTLNCLAFAHRNDAAFLFLSTSRVFGIENLNQLPFEETSTRYSWDCSGEGTKTGDGLGQKGFSREGINEEFDLGVGARSFYGASKLACELVIQEYTYNYGMQTLINRCGILTGPWQMGKVDQGVVMLWVAHHELEKPLNYIGFGGSGKQVRDMLHVDDLFELLVKQIADEKSWRGDIYHVGGGEANSASLLELTEICRDVTGRAIELGRHAETNPLDLRIFITDTTKVRDRFKWRPKRSVHNIADDIHRWIVSNRDDVKSIMAS